MHKQNEKKDIKHQQNKTDSNYANIVSKGNSNMGRNMAGQMHSGKYNMENRKNARVLCASMFFIK